MNENLYVFLVEICDQNPKNFWILRPHEGNLFHVVYHGGWLVSQCCWNTSSLAALLVPCFRFLLRANRERSSENSTSFTTRLYSYSDSLESILSTWSGLRSHFATHTAVPSHVFCLWLPRISKSGKLLFLFGWEFPRLCSSFLYNLIFICFMLFDEYALKRGAMPANIWNLGDLQINDTWACTSLFDFRHKFD